MLDWNGAGTLPEDHIEGALLEVDAARFLADLPADFPEESGLLVQLGFGLAPDLDVSRLGDEDEAVDHVSELRGDGEEGGLGLRRHVLLLVLSGPSGSCENLRSDAMLRACLGTERDGTEEREAGVIYFLLVCVSG
jgi:hypothetical protein